jgi:sugar lactone lactonase YvrE
MPAADVRNQSRSSKPSVRPRRWTPPARVPDPQGARPVAGATVLPVPGHGCEDVLVLPDGRVLTGVEDGRVIALTPDGRTTSVVGDTGGRPLGLEWHPDGWVVVCDAVRGLLRLDLESGRVSELVTGFRGEPFVFCNNAAVAADGTIYFTDSSRRFGIDAFRAELVEHSDSGRLFRRAPQGAVDLLADDLSFPNGVALAADESFVAFAETASYRVRRYWLDGPASGQVAVYVDDLPGFPDNLSTGSTGLVWVAIAAPRDPVLDLLLPRAPVLRKAVWAVPERLQPRAKRRFWVLGLDAVGDPVHAFGGEHPGFHMATGVRESNGRLWLGSLERSAVAVLDV